MRLQRNALNVVKLQVSLTLCWAMLGRGADGIYGVSFLEVDAVEEIEVDFGDQSFDLEKKLKLPPTTAQIFELRVSVLRDLLHLCLRPPWDSPLLKKSPRSGPTLGW